MLRKTALFLLLPATLACIPLYDKIATVGVQSERALIVWDPATKVEHFVREANFLTTDPDFGFLVPTPALPTIAPSSSGLLYEFALVAAPKMRIEKKKSVHFSSKLFLPVHTRAVDVAAATKAATAGAPNPVDVVSQQKIGNYDVSVLKASDAPALAKWLKVHHYPVNEQAAEWLKVYVQKSWYLTAFKVASNQTKRTAVSLPVVDISFKTDQPFYPYREPSSKIKGSRTLDVYLVSNARMAGTLGKTQPWVGPVTYAKPLDNPYLTTLSDHLHMAGHKLTDQAWLTAFHDTSSPRIGTDDVFFQLSSDQTPVTPPDIVVVQPEILEIPMILWGSALLAALTLAALGAKKLIKSRV